jgi:hypothetical protein
MDFKTLSFSPMQWLCLGTSLFPLLLLAQAVKTRRSRNDRLVSWTVWKAQEALRERMQALFEAIDRHAPATVAFNGTRGTIRFVAPDGAAASRRFSLGLTKMGDVALSCCVGLKEDCLCPYLPHSDDEVLIRHVSRLELAYFEADPSDEKGGAWRDAWKVPVPPSLIRLRVIFPLHDARWWPDLIIETGVAPAFSWLGAARLQARAGRAP